jgi:elongation factor P
MANIQAKDLRRGTAINYEGVPCRVLEFEHRTPGNLRAFVQAKLRNLINGTQREVRFSSTETIERISIQLHEMEYLYRDNAGYVFMDVETYEQMTIADEDLGERALWLSEGMRIGVELLDGRPIGIQLPKSIEATVKETEAVIKGQTAARSAKPATLQNGLRVQVPPFIAAGDRIRVDPEQLSYIDRVK